MITNQGGDRIRVYLLVNDSSPMPPEYTDSPTSLTGGWTAYVTTTPIRNYPSDVVDVSVAARLSDNVVALAQGSKVPPDDVVTMVQSLVVS